MPWSLSDRRSVAAGASFAGRIAASVVTSVGLGELVTHSLEEYEALALRLANDPAYLASIKAKLARNRLTFPLFDAKRSTRQMEAAYTAVWQRYQQRRDTEVADGRNGADQTCVTPTVRREVPIGRSLNQPPLNLAAHPIHHFVDTLFRWVSPP